MELRNGKRKEKSEYEMIWVPKTPSKTTPTWLKSEDVLSATTSTISSAILDNQHNGLIRCDIKGAMRTKRKGSKKKRYRPKVVQGVKIRRSLKTKSPNPSTPKPSTPKPLKRGTLRKSLCKSDIVNAVHKSSKDVCLDSPRVSDQSPEVSLHISTTPIDEIVPSENFDNYEQENGPEASDLSAEEYSDKSSVDLKPELESKSSCRRPLSFSLSFENNGGGYRGDDDRHASGATWQGCQNSPRDIVYHRKRFKFGQRDLCKFGNSTQQSDRFSSELLVYQRKRFKLGGCGLLNHKKIGVIYNGLITIISTKDASLNVVKKKRTGERKKKVLPTLATVVLGTEEESVLNCKQAHETLESSLIIPVAQSCVPPPCTSGVRTINISQPTYCGVFIPNIGPPQKKLKGLEDVIKNLQNLCFDDIRKQSGPKKKEKSGDIDKSEELVVYDTNKLVPKVVINRETEREWSLLMQAFNSGAEEKTNKDRNQYWEEERRAMRIKLLTFLVLMHIIQGDRPFTEWKGSVVDSVVGAYLTQNVHDHMSSSAFMSLASRFPFKPKHEIVCMNSFSPGTPPLVEEVKQERGVWSRNKNHIEGESELQLGSPSVTRLRGPSDKSQERQVDWDELRRTYGGGKRDTTGRYADSVNWEAVRVAPPEEVSEAIRMRGQHVVIGWKIQLFLNRILKDHGSLDLEWLRNVPPAKTKEYLLSFYGLGLKSVECIRLLCLRHHAFPVDVNVARLAVRLGWVPLEALPGGLQFHLLEEYPIADAVQLYLWPRLCTLNKDTLYELHYQMITFGKVFCKKRNPGCETCPMRVVCKHAASKLARSRPSLPMTEKKRKSSEIISIADIDDSSVANATTTDSFPPSGLKKNDVHKFLVEHPPSPLRVPNRGMVRDIEDWDGQIVEEDNNADEDGNVVINMDIIHTVRLGTEEGIENEDHMPIITLGSNEELEKRFREAMHKSNIDVVEDDVSKALVALTSEASSIPTPKLKNVGRLKTVHHVYELPDSHPILAEVQKRELDDPSPYLLVVWASSNMKDRNSDTVPGTLMIPCRTANRGSFPLNGTYFQVNEIFADDESSEHPMQVPREWLWNLTRRFVYCGSSASAIFTAVPVEEIQHCFWQGLTNRKIWNRRRERRSIFSWIMRDVLIEIFWLLLHWSEALEKVRSNHLFRLAQAALDANKSVIIWMKLYRVSGSCRFTYSNLHLIHCPPDPYPEPNTIHFYFKKRWSRV